MRLEGKVAIVSGGARGMGASEARIFAREGAKVVIGDLLEDEGKRVEAEIAEAGGEAMFVKLDVTQEKDWRDAVDRTVGQIRKTECAGQQRWHQLRLFPGHHQRRRVGAHHGH